MVVVELVVVVVEWLFDLVLFSCKVYDLDSLIDVIVLVVGEYIIVLLIFNGLCYYVMLDVCFGVLWVLGGLCFISVMKGEGGEVLYLGKLVLVIFGECEGMVLSVCCE